MHGTWSESCVMHAQQTHGCVLFCNTKLAQLAVRSELSSVHLIELTPICFALY